VTIVDAPISGLEATNDSPTELGNTTHLTATIATGTNVSYDWSFGDGSFGNGENPTHIYPDLGSYTAIVTATNSVSSAAATTLVSIVDVPVTGLLAENDSPTELGFATSDCRWQAGKCELCLGLRRWFNGR
jgi:PKD repeat protein